MSRETQGASVVVVTRDPDLEHAVEAAVATLGNRGPRLSHVTNCAECLIATRLLDPVLLVVDDGACESPGFDFIQELHRTRPSSYVVYVATQHSHELERQVRRAGVLFYLARPVERAALGSILHGILERLVRDAG
jgi:DNA-binding response OmpR family regulator